MQRRIEGFDRTEQVVEHIISRHNVCPDEVEECFFLRPIQVRRGRDDRYQLFSRMEAGRYLFVVFVWQDRMVRVITARDMTPAERSCWARK